MTDSPELRRMSDAEYKGLPLVSALPLRHGKLNVVTENGSNGRQWDITLGHYLDVHNWSEDDIDNYPEMRLLKSILANTTDFNHPPDGPVINFKSAMWEHLPWLREYLWENDGDKDALARLFEYATDEQKKQVKPVLEAIPELIRRRLEIEVISYLQQINQSIIEIRRRIEGGLWVAAVRLSDIRFEEPTEFRLGQLGEFTETPSTKKSKSGLDVPRIEPTIRLDDEDVLLPQQASLYGLATQKVKSS